MVLERYKFENEYFTTVGINVLCRAGKLELPLREKKHTRQQIDRFKYNISQKYPHSINYLITDIDNGCSLKLKRLPRG